jgi:hypothetical protein
MDRQMGILPLFGGQEYTTGGKSTRRGPRVRDGEQGLIRANVCGGGAPNLALTWVVIAPKRPPRYVISINESGPQDFQLGKHVVTQTPEKEDKVHT